jgi:hypothetical protein
LWAKLREEENSPPVNKPANLAQTEIGEMIQMSTETKEEVKHAKSEGNLETDSELDEEELKDKADGEIVLSNSFISEKRVSNGTEPIHIKRPSMIAEDNT